MRKVALVGLVLVAAFVIAWLGWLRPEPELTFADPDCPPDAPVMAIDLYGDLRQDDVAVVDRNLEVHRLTKDHASIDPSFSPDGSQIVFTSGSEGFHEECCGYSDSKIYVMDSDGSNQRRLVRGKHQDNSPAWSPAGEEIAFVRGAKRLMLVSASGDDPRTLYRSKTPIYDPEWSPDGSRIAFVTGEFHEGDIVVIERSGGEPEVLAERVGASDLSWSPDGKTLAFGANFAIYTATFEEPNPRLFAEDANTPAWSPDGNHLAYYFNDERHDRYELVTQSARGGDQVPLKLKRKDIYSFAVDLDWLDCP